MCSQAPGADPVGMDTVDESLFSVFPPREGSLIPILQEIQKTLGYLSKPAMRQAALYTGVSESGVWGVATFYAQFRFKPQGKKIISVCRGTACHVLGAVNVLEEIERQLGIKEGETTDDLEYSLRTVACIGCCSLAPALMINNEVHTRMTPRKVAKLFKKGK